MSLRKVSAIVVPLLVLVATAQPVDARAETAFWMSGMISDPATPDPACGGLRIAKSTGTLRGVPLGRAAWTGTECIDLTVEPGAFVIRDGRFTLTSARGTIRGIYEGRAGAPSTHGHVHVAGTFRVTSGTGAYRRVIGGGILTADVQPLVNEAQLDLAGRVRF